VRAFLILSIVRGLTRPDANVVTPPRYLLPRRGADRIMKSMFSLARARFPSSSSSTLSLQRRTRYRWSAPLASARAQPLAREQLHVSWRTSLAPKETSRATTVATSPHERYLAGSGGRS
jgi:hypothetical protein